MHSTEHHRKLNSPEAAEYLGISVSTLSKRRVDGDGPQYLKLGRGGGRNSTRDPGRSAVEVPDAVGQGQGAQRRGLVRLHDARRHHGVAGARRSSQQCATSTPTNDEQGAGIEGKSMSSRG